ncbi:rCG26802, partial [Rattus norvegicus]
MRLSRAGGL